jgi:3-oxoacyl-[acyl-carrier protein] reductase
MILNEQVALITGASRGIGRTIALELAQAGAAVVVNYRSDHTAANAVVEEITRLGGHAQAIAADVAAPPQVADLIEQVIAAHGRIDILVNNAGITRDNLLATMSDDDIGQVIATNLLGAFYCIRAIIPWMLRRHYGRIINISSSAATKPGRGQANYAAAKGGLEALTRALAVELAPRQILVNAIAPGVIDTEMSRQIREAAAEQIDARLLLKRPGTTAEVARLALFLATPANAYMTGQVLHLDGGLKMA